MAPYANYALRVPTSLMDDLRSAAERDGVSLNGFIVQAVAEKIAVLRSRDAPQLLAPDQQEAYLDQRAEFAKANRMNELLRKAGTTDDVRPGDELPPHWLDDTTTSKSV